MKKAIFLLIVTITCGMQNIKAQEYTGTFKLSETDMKAICYDRNDTLGFRGLSSKTSLKEYKGRKNRHILRTMRSIQKAIEGNIVLATIVDADKSSINRNSCRYILANPKYKLTSDGVILIGSRYCNNSGPANDIIRNWGTNTIDCYFISHKNRKVKLTQTLSEDWSRGEISFELLRYNYPDIEENDTIMKSPPTFIGGSEALEKYLLDNTLYPLIALENGVYGRVTVAFTVNPDKSVTDIKVVRGIDRHLDTEAKRVVELMNNMWLPGTVDEKETPVEVYLRIRFIIR